MWSDWTSNPKIPQWVDKPNPNPRTKGAGKGQRGQKGKGVHAVEDAANFHFCLTDEPQACEPCCEPAKQVVENLSPPADSRPAEGAKWFVRECDVECVVNADAFPTISTAETMNADVKAKFKPMTKMTQKEFKKILRIKKQRADEQWFNTASIEDLQKLAKTIQANDEMANSDGNNDIINDDQRSGAIGDKDSDVNEDGVDSQSCMSFANERIKDAIGNDSFCGLFTDDEPGQVLCLN